MLLYVQSKPLLALLWIIPTYPGLSIGYQGEEISVSSPLPSSGSCRVTRTTLSLLFSKPGKPRSLAVSHRTLPSPALISSSGCCCKAQNCTIFQVRRHQRWLQRDYHLCSHCAWCKDAFCPPGCLAHCQITPERHQYLKGEGKRRGGEIPGDLKGLNDRTGLEADGRLPRPPGARARRPPRRGSTESRPSGTHPPAAAAALTGRRLRFRVAWGGGEVPPRPPPPGAAVPPPAEGGKRRRPWATSTRCRGGASPRGSWRSTSGSPCASWGASRRSAGCGAGMGLCRAVCAGAGAGPAAAPGGLGAGRERAGWGRQAVALPGAFGAHRPNAFSRLKCSSVDSS